MPINASPHFERAQAEYEQAQTTEQKIHCLKKMLALSPKHKGAENLNAQLKRRLAKLKYTKQKESKKPGSTQKGIKKETMQAVIVGFANTGKSSLLKILTNAEPKIADYKFTTKQPIIGMMDYQGANIQLIENPAIESENYDKGLTNTADTIVILVTELNQIDKIQQHINKAFGRQIIVFNNKNNLDERKLETTLKSRKYDFALVDLKNQENLNELKEKIFKSFGKIRVYTKDPIKGKSPKPMILKPDSTVKDATEKILKGFSEKIKETKIWGPSSKFPGQKVGLRHKLRDLDVIKFKTR